MTVAFPLQWPDGWPRTLPLARKNGDQFSRKRHDVAYGWTPILFDYARKSLSDELDRLKATSVVMSSNVPLRADGMPRSDSGNSRTMADPGVAIYFVLKGQKMTMAQDAFVSPAANFRSLALAVDALRSLERHGGGIMMGRAFEGFAQLEGPRGAKPARPWWDVFGFSVDERTLLSAAEIEARWRRMSKTAHPDAGGTAERMAELNEAKQSALKEVTTS